MKLPGVKSFATSMMCALVFAGCGGGGGSAPSASTATPAPAPTPTATPIVTGTPGPITASWRGDGSFSAQSDPNWPLSFAPVPGDAVSSITQGPPITYSSLHQSVSITFTQNNYYGLLPILVTFINRCAGIDGSPIANRQYRITYSGTGSSNCYIQFEGNAPGYYPGDAISFKISVPTGG